MPFLKPNLVKIYMEIENMDGLGIFLPLYLNVENE